ncbi:hypothetical protein [Pseudomonas sp. UMAB-40]|uniref:hypothetical protein n=1 Tax=Pseudomonas sp. UMAB-40 TaxID=1365407 RepID=UPI001C598D17|nr:hypothetical protein [Pseudomonas sp. UMAB-40]
MTKFKYPEEAFELISQLLVVRAAEMGAQAFAVREEIVEAAAAVDEAGPLTWALTIHADALARMSGMSTAQDNSLPFTMVQDPESPFGNLCVMQEGGIPLSLAVQFLDSALEHCICVGMRELDISPSEWEQLPFNQQVVAIEPYFTDLQAHWVSPELESSERSTMAINFPTLLTLPLLEEYMLNQRTQLKPEEQPQTISRVVTFGSMR